MSNEIDKEWFEEEEVGGVITKDISYVTVGKDSSETVITKSIEVRVMSGLDYAGYQSSLVVHDGAGNVTVDLKAGQAKLVMLSLGWTQKQVDSVKRNKPMACWSAIVEAVATVNRVGSQVMVDTEKNGDGASSESPSS